MHLGWGVLVFNTYGGGETYLKSEDWNVVENSIAFGKSTSQRIYREQHTPKIGWKLHKYRLKHALHTLDDHFR